MKNRGYIQNGGTGVSQPEHTEGGATNLRGANARGFGLFEFPQQGPQLVGDAMHAIRTPTQNQNFEGEKMSEEIQRSIRKHKVTITQTEGRKIVGHQNPRSEFKRFES